MHGSSEQFRPIVELDEVRIMTSSQVSGSGSDFSLTQGSSSYAPAMLQSVLAALGQPVSSANPSGSDADGSSQVSAASNT